MHYFVFISNRFSVRNSTATFAYLHNSSVMNWVILLLCISYLCLSGVLSQCTVMLNEINVKGSSVPELSEFIELKKCFAKLA